MFNLSTSTASTKRVISKSLARKMLINSCIEASISGIPCLIEVDTCNVVKGSFSYNAPSDLDYSGYSEIEFTVYDRKGYRAVWLEKKMTDDDIASIEELILEANKDDGSDNGFDD